MNNLKKKLLKNLGKKIKQEKEIVLMPHFCVDNFIQGELSLKDFTKILKSVASRGGGSYLLNQVQMRGGKAANVASGISSLGLKPTLIAKTNSEGLELLKSYFKGRKVDFFHVSNDGPLAFTTVIELKEGNVMLNSPGALENFGPNILTDKDVKLLKRASLVCISDWSQNRKGTDLAEYVFKVAGGIRIFDPGDSAAKQKNEKQEIKGVVRRVIQPGLIDVFLASEGEIKKYGMNFNLEKAAANLAQYCRVCVHNDLFVQSFLGNEKTLKISTFKVKPLRLTGAGDSWNVGYLYGEIAGMEEEQKLLLGNAVAAYYISSKDAKHPTVDELIKFIKNTPLKK